MMENGNKTASQILSVEVAQHARQLNNDSRLPENVKIDRKYISLVA
jgi:hypothetical protein